MFDRARKHCRTIEKSAAAIKSPVSTLASVPVVERVAEAEIPVVCYNTCLNDAETERLERYPIKVIDSWLEKSDEVPLPVYIAAWISY